MKNKKLLAAGGTITACKKPNVSKLFKAWKENKEELKFEKAVSKFTPNDLIAWRKERGWTQPDLAEWCGRKTRAIQRMENGTNPIPRWLVRLIFFEDN